MHRNHIKNIGKFMWGTWTILGFYRGHQMYVKQHNEDKKHNKNIPYYYITQVGWSIAMSIIYATPFTIGISIVREMYNLERAIRGIELDE